MISTHILDTSKGVPAAAVALKLSKKNGEAWQEISIGVTNADGRFSFQCEKQPGEYQILFGVEDYLQKNSGESFFAQIKVEFKIHNTQRNYHVPLLLSPFGYSTYRGS